MKKKIISILLAGAIAASLYACGDTEKSSGGVPAGMSEGYYSAGVKAIAVMDDAIDLKIDYDAAAERLDMYAEAMEKELESDAGQKALKNADVDAETEELILKQNINNLKTASESLKLSDWEGESDLSKLIDDRNDFAEDFGVSDRSY